MLKAGQVIDRFELVCPIGEGGMAHVWAARERGRGSGDRLVALKIIHSRFVEDQAFRDMFLDEARVVFGIEHPNVARVYDLVDVDGQLCLAMEYVDGESVFSLISQYRTAPLPFALKVCADVCAGLHAVHSLKGADGRSRNIVHRDVSPQNILISVAGDTKIIDFGIAHARDRAAQPTALGTVKGKIRYMAHEQARRGELGPWTDVFGIGATLFRMVVGKPPYTSESDVMSMQALLQGMPPLIPFPPELPTPVVDVIKKAIAPAAADRYQSAAELQRALLDLLAKGGERPDVMAFVDAQMSDKTRERRAQLAGIATPDLPGRNPARHRAHGASSPPTTPDKKRGDLPPPPAPAMPSNAPPRDPGFMDVHAILAQANNVPDLPVPLPKPLQPPQGQGAPRPQQRLELAIDPSKRTKTEKSAGGLRTAILAIAGIVLLFLFLVAVPSIVKSRAIAQAREAGFDMTVEHVGVGFGTATLRGVKLKAIRVPGVTATIDELYVTGSSVKELRAVGLRVTLEGPTSDFEMGLALTLAENRRSFAGTGSAPRRYTIANGQILWKGPNGSGLEATGVGLEIESRGVGFEDVHGNAEKLTYNTGKTTLGPWGVSFENTPSNARLRFALDPAVPDGPSILLASTPSAPAQITVKIGRSSFANLGMKPDEIGLPADGSSEIATSLVGTVAPDGKLAIAGPTSLWGLRVKDTPKPIDLKIDGGASGVLGQPLDIDKGSTVAFGPFVAQLSGTITPQNTSGSVRVDVLAKANTIPCATLARTEIKTMGSFAAMLAAVGQQSGAIRVTGAVNATCAVKWDSRDPDDTSITWVAKETCGLSIFGM